MRRSRLLTRGRQESLDDACRCFVGGERQPHFAGVRPRYFRACCCKGLGLRVPQPFGDVFDRETRIAKQTVRVEYARRGEDVSRARQAGTREPARARAAVTRARAATCWIVWTAPGLRIASSSTQRSSGGSGARAVVS